MDNLCYKTFVWPHNPHTYREEYVREPKFYTEDGIQYYGSMGPMKQKITGKGVFFGENAFETFRALAEVFSEEEAGDLDHPLWGIRHCYFTKLELTQEPKENYVSYTFEFTVARANGTVPC